MITVLESPQAKKGADKIAKEIHLSLLREGRPVYLKAAGMSMYPFIKDGDMIKVVPAAEKNVKIGDIVAVDNVYGPRGWFYVHRVVKVFNTKEGKVYLTKGDGNKRQYDKPVGFKRLAGRVAEIKRDNLAINLESRLWKRLNPAIAYFSLKHPAGLRGLARYINFLILPRIYGIL